MLKKYRTTLIIGTLVMLLPVVVGLILWNKLPEELPTHFGPGGEPDQYSSKAFAVFGLPVIIMALHWVCVLGSLKMDPKARNIDGRMMGLVLWICPAISVLAIGLTYGTALGADMQVEIILPMLVGLMMVIIGNWLPKCKQSYTMGIKLPWTLHDEENWNRTHRFAGPLWVAGGMIIMVCALIGGAFLWVMLAAFLVMIIAPTVYSYLLFRAKSKQETEN